MKLFTVASESKFVRGISILVCLWRFLDSSCCRTFCSIWSFSDIPWLYIGFAAGSFCHFSMTGCVILSTFRGGVESAIFCVCGVMLASGQ